MSMNNLIERDAYKHELMRRKLWANTVLKSFQGNKDANSTTVAYNADHILASFDRNFKEPIFKTLKDT